MGNTLSDNRTKRKTALVTGASGGIGEAFAKLLAKEKYNLVLIARNQQKLEILKQGLEQEHGVRVETLSKDLTQALAPSEIFGWLQTVGVEIDLLVNNAGFAEYGNFYDLSLESQLNVINLNISTLTALTRLLLPTMIVKKQGKILNVASTAAFQPGPKMAVYYATKAYVVSFSEALHDELRNSGVTVSVLCPGPTKTDFLGKSPELAKTRLVKTANSMSAETVALAGYNGLLAKKSLIIPGFQNKFLAFGTRLLPRRLVTILSRWTLEQK